MKRLTVFILILLGNSGRLAACSYYPGGDEVRFSIFNPHIFGLGSYSQLFYTSHYFGWFNEDRKQIDDGEKMNIDLWRKRCKCDLPDDVIYAAVYGDSVRPGNAFVKRLYELHDQEAIDYLDFARECTGLTNLKLDPWERNKDSLTALRGDYIAWATRMARTCSTGDIRQRYAFQAVRLTFYNHSAIEVRDIYASFFEGSDEKNIIDYWALYFRAAVETDDAKRNFMAAQVFANAPDKRLASYYYYKRDVPLKGVLALAKNNRERAAVWLLEGVRRPRRTLECMQPIDEVDPQSEGLGLLLLREVNKLEDWIYTPYYTRFEPSVTLPGRGNAYSSPGKMERRILADRNYAWQLLNFVAGRKSTGQHPLLWKTAHAYLLFMTKDYGSALTKIGTVDVRGDSAVGEQLKMIRSLCLVAIQDPANAIIPRDAREVLLRQYRVKNQRFIFAMAKELEFLGNTTDAALLMSKINPGGTSWEEEVYWNADGKFQSYYWNYHRNYFGYIDAEYTPAQVKALLADIESNRQTDTFSTWKYSAVKLDIPRLWDLLGTKYMRENRPGKALAAFEKVNDTLWTSSHAPFSTYLDANPFYANFYSEHAKNSADTVRFNKEEIARQLIRYLAIAGDSSAPHRDYYYFIAANCYLNMTYHGNSWMMKRYYWTSAATRSGITGNDDFYGCDLAKAHYLKAYSVTKSKKFAALCLRMAGRCESYRLSYVKGKKQDDYYYTTPTRATKGNVYYRKLKKEYPGDYDDLISNCYSFDEYFKTWK